MLTWPHHNQPLVILAPMDGYTDPPFRRFIKRVAPRALVFSEFLSAKLVAAKPSVAERLFKIYPDEEPVVIQLYGKDSEHFRKAALLAQEMGAAGIDINMGCPAKKVVAHRHGSALMKEIDLACDIIATLKDALDIPVTVKTRLGWEDDSKLIPFAQKLQAVGLDAITIHGRTYSQKFDGEADWNPIYQLKRNLDIPVFGNGDITTTAEAVDKLGNLDGVMIGRGAVSDPWLLARATAAFAGEPVQEDALTFADKLPYWKTFAEMCMEGHEELSACRAFRKYLARLVRDLGLSPDIRHRAVRVETLSQIHQILETFAQATKAA